MSYRYSVLCQHTKPPTVEREIEKKVLCLACVSCLKRVLRDGGLLGSDSTQLCVKTALLSSNPRGLINPEELYIGREDGGVREKEREREEEVRSEYERKSEKKWLSWNGWTD